MTRERVVAKITPTGIYRSTQTTVVTNASNMYTNTDSDTYATVSGNAAYLGYFDFSIIPNDVKVVSYSVLIKVASNQNNSSSNAVYIYNGDLPLSGCSSQTIFFRNAPSVITLNTGTLTWDQIADCGDNLNIYLPASSSRDTYVYGAEIYVEYLKPVNKVTYDGETLIDLTSDTVSANKLATGYTAHDASGAIIQGAAKMGSAYQDGDGYVVLEEDESSAPQGTLSITANGTYDVSDYAGANVQLGGMSEIELERFIKRDYQFTNIEWPSGLTGIGSYAFAECTHFNTSSLPSGLLFINQYAFYGCSKLSLTKLPDTLTGTIPYYAFCTCTKLALTELPSGITAIAGYAFQHCHNLAITELPSGVTVINVGAFQYCNNITSISCEGAITTLGTSAFTGSSTYPMSLTSASFPNMVLSSNISTVFGSNTAANACQLLEFCDIGSTVGIAANAFANCYALDTLVLRKTASVCTLANVSAFTNTPMSGYNNKTGTVYVPSALISSYQTATNWSTLYNNGTVTFVAIEGSKYERE